MAGSADRCGTWNAGLLVLALVTGVAAGGVGIVALCWWADEHVRW